MNYKIIIIKIFIIINQIKENNIEIYAYNNSFTNNTFSIFYSNTIQFRLVLI